MVVWYFNQLIANKNTWHTNQFLPLKQVSFAKIISALCFSSINPVTGVVEDEQPNPMDGMTEEQKEYEAMKLINMLEKLSRWVETQATKKQGMLTNI